MVKEKFLVKGLGGKKTLRGGVRVQGAKNAILPLMVSSLLFQNEIRIGNVPRIGDIESMSELLTSLGATVSRKGEVLAISAKSVRSSVIDDEIAKRLRASIILTGPLLARFGHVVFPHPGGCVIGARPIDFFLSNFEKMGAKVKEDSGLYHLEVAKTKLKAAEIFFHQPSVTGTETFIMTALLAEGRTVLENCTLEPEVANLIDFLSARGAIIRGRGTPTIEVEGGEMLRSGSAVHEAIPDRIEAGSLLILASLCGSDVTLTDLRSTDLRILIEVLRDSGVPIEVSPSSIKISGNGQIPNSKFKAFNIKTHEFPGFPTDLQAPITLFLTQASGESIVFETIFEGRLHYTNDLVKMGAEIKMWDAHCVMVKGPSVLSGRELEGPDLRAGLAFIIAALVAEGNSVIHNAHLIDRGYEGIEGKLKALGAEISRAHE